MIYTELGKCVTRLLYAEPFLGHLMADVVRSVSKEVKTAAVSLRGNKVVLLVNPEFFMKTLLNQEERVGVVKHELLHLLFRHLKRIVRAKHDPTRVNVAMDIVVNQFIGPPWQLPDGAMTLERFADLNLLPDQGFQYYYDRLAEAEKNKPPGPKGPPGEDPADILDRLREEDWDAGHGEWDKNKDLEGNETADVHEDAEDMEIDRIISKAKSSLNAHQWGQIPGSIQGLINEAIAHRQPKVNWRQALRIFGASASHTRVRATQQRESRRFGTRPGVKIQALQRLAVVIDTSGSVGDDDLAAFFAEIHAMWRANAAVLVIECDTEVQHAWEYKGRAPESVKGRGGTAFDPAFQWLRDNRSRAAVDGIIYLTDGGGPEPQVRPPAILCWVITANGSVGPQLKWGRVIKMT